MNARTYIAENGLCFVFWRQAIAFAHGLAVSGSAIGRPVVKRKGPELWQVTWLSREPASGRFA